MTGGEANWRYTGTAQINGVREALLENSSTGESVFLRVGQSWKQAVLKKIENEAVVMTGPGGFTQRLQLGEQEPAKLARNARGPGGNPGALLPAVPSTAGMGGRAATPSAASIDGIGPVSAGRDVTRTR